MAPPPPPAPPPRWPIGAHWATYAYTPARALGFTFTWINADVVGDPVYADDLQAFIDSGLAFILELKFTSEARLVNRDGVWERDVRNIRDLLRARGLLARCLAPQLDDEFLSRFATSAGSWPRADWPSVPRGHGRKTWHRYLPEIAAHVAARIADVRRIWGADLPARGIGMAETGGIVPPPLPLDWWGVNGYVGHGRPTPAAIHALYDQVAAHTTLPLMPVLGVYEDRTTIPLPSVPTLGAAYLPVLEAHAAQIWAVGVFCLHHPSRWPGADPAHVQGRGLLDGLPAEHRAAVRWLTRTYGT